MGIWPFGRAKADVESASRVVVLRARDAVALRAKLTVRLLEPQTQATVDELTETCSELLRSVVREAPDAPSVLGFETAIAAEIVARLPRDVVAIRGVEVAGLHVIGDLGHVTTPHTALSDMPAWLLTGPPSAPTSSGPLDRPDRPTPVHAFPSKEPGAGPRGVTLTPVQPMPVVKRMAPAPATPGDRVTPVAERTTPVAADRGTPVQPIAAVKPVGERGTPVQPIPVTAPAALDRGTPVQPIAAVKAVGERGTPVQPIPVTAPAAVKALEAERGTPVQPLAAVKPVAVERGIPVQPTPVTAPAADHHDAALRSSPANRASEMQTVPAPPLELGRTNPAPGAVAPVVAPPDGHRGALPPPPPATPAGARDPLTETGERAVPPHQAVTIPARPLWSAPSRSGHSSAPPPPPSQSGSRAAAPSSRSGSALGGYTRTSSSSHLTTVRAPAMERRTSSSSQLQAQSPPSSAHLHGAGPPSSSSPSSVRATNRPPPAAFAARRRVVASRLALPMGAGPYEVARGLTPLFRDTAARILVAFLRAYDLTVIRRVPFDGIESDILSSLTAPSNGAPGSYAAGHATETQRWRAALGASKMDQLQREANLASAAIGYEMLSAEGVAQSTTNSIIEGLAGSAFGDPDLVIELGRYLFPVNGTTSAETLANMILVAGEDMPPGMETALDPLFDSLRDDISAAALIARDVMESSS